jgi:threonine dehydrogenase-like Zn-dependent dehydrogenase
MALNATLLALNATMRAVVWSGIPFNVTVQNVPVPTIQAATDARVRITAAAICGTDLHTYHGTYGSDEAPWVMGHEAVGIIESVGSGVTNIQVGDHVVIPDNFDLGYLNMALAEPWANDGQATGLGLNYGDFYGCQGILEINKCLKKSANQTQPSMLSCLSQTTVSGVYRQMGQSTHLEKSTTSLPRTFSQLHGVVSPMQVLYQVIP